MKRIFNLLAFTALAVTGLAGCNSDPVFPDPGFDLITDKKITVRRDTCDVFHIKLNVNAPGGVDVIQILDGRTLEVVDQVTEHRGKKKVQLDYPLDLTAYDANVDTVLMYNVRIATLDKRGFNTTFRLEVKKLSFPELTLTGNDVIGTVAPVVVAQGAVNTGIYKIKSVKVFVDDEEKYSVPAEELKDLSEYDLSAYINHNFEKDHDYDMRIEVTDQRGEMRQWHITVKGIELKKPQRISVKKDGRACSLITFEYDEADRITRIDNVHEPSMLNATDCDYTVYLDYNDKGQVTSFAYHYSSSASSRHAALFEYDGDKIAKITHNRYDSEWIFDSTYETIQNFRYYPDGVTVHSFDLAATTVELEYKDGFAEEEKIFAQRWAANLASFSPSSVRIRDGFVSVLNPVWLEGMPPYWCPRSIGRQLTDIFWYKYVYTKEVPGPKNTERDSNPNIYFHTFTYRSDDIGQLETFERRVYSGSSWYTYTFEYE